MAPSHFTLRGETQGHQDFEALDLIKELGPMLLLNINRKPYMGGGIQW